jgi:DNA-binding NarL/FixJ family response regulator
MLTRHIQSVIFGPSYLGLIRNTPSCVFPALGVALKIRRMSNTVLDQHIGLSSASNREIRLLVVDDHPIVREGLAHLLDREQDMRAEWQASSIKDALNVCRSCAPNMAVVDLSLGDGSGLDLIKLMRASQPSMPILVMSMHDESLYADRALRAGARGYVMKHVAPKHIVAAIRQVREGHIYLSDRMRSQLLERVTAGGAGAESPALAQLSNRELEVFQLIGQGLKKGAIAARLRRSVNTVEAHRANIKRKLKVRDAAELNKLAFLHTENGF